jgi:hypothetical protein
MTPEAAYQRAQILLAHAWMLRTFLKHADEIQDDAEMLEVPRTLYDSIRAVEPAREQNDVPTYLRRLKGKLPKLRRVAELFATRWRTFSTHTNYELAAVALSGLVVQLEELFAQVQMESSAQ